MANMEVHRVDGIKYNFERLTAGELEGIRRNLIEKHAQVTGEIALLDSVLFERANDQLPLEQGYEL